MKLCNNYFSFAENLLDDCTCLFGIRDVAEFMEINLYSDTENQFRKLIQKLYSDNEVYFLPVPYISVKPKSKDLD